MPCAHEPCTCIAEQDDFCSPQCRTLATEGVAGASMDIGSVPLTECTCGHPDCAGTRTAALDM